ncbi:hypothetical protein HK101_001803, partial [Irineochytrium annulatum]
MASEMDAALQALHVGVKMFLDFEVRRAKLRRSENVIGSLQWRAARQKEQKELLEKYAALEEYRDEVEGPRLAEAIHIAVEDRVASIKTHLERKYCTEFNGRLAQLIKGVDRLQQVAEERAGQAYALENELRKLRERELEREERHGREMAEMEARVKRRVQERVDELERGLEKESESVMEATEKCRVEVAMTLQTEEVGKVVEKVRLLEDVQGDPMQVTTKHYAGRGGQGEVDREKAMVEMQLNG